MAMCPSHFRSAVVRGAVTEQQYDFFREYCYVQVTTSTGNLVNTAKEVKLHYRSPAKKMTLSLFVVSATFLVCKSVCVQVVKCLEDVGLSAERQTITKKLSGGQKRKLSLAMAIIGDPRVRIQLPCVKSQISTK